MKSEKNKQPARKLQALRHLMENEERPVIALSGGTDSMLLTFIAHSVLGDRASAVTAVSEFLDPEEQNAVRSFVRTYGIRHEFFEISMLGNATVRGNPPDRCYHCKKAVFTLLLRYAQERAASGSERVTVLDGTNVDDRADQRPGMRALGELLIRSPYVEVGMGKADIIQAARGLGLEEYVRPSNSCLATRIGTGIPISADKLCMVQKAEEYLRGLGFPVVRVRYQEPAAARIEVPPAEIGRMLDAGLSPLIRRALKQIGFAHVSVDLDGYGS
jgi:uncharacterized protein